MHALQNSPLRELPSPSWLHAVSISTVALTQLKRNSPGFNCVNLGKSVTGNPSVSSSVPRFGRQLTAMQSWLANVAKWPGGASGHGSERQ